MSLACCRTWCHTDLQHLYCKVLINKTMSIKFHKKYFKIVSHSLGFLWIYIHGKSREKYLDRLADSSKCSNINRMVAGSRLSWCIMDFISCLQLFKHTFLNSMSLASCRTWCPTDLQHFCCKALINKAACS